MKTDSIFIKVTIYFFYISFISVFTYTIHAQDQKTPPSAAKRLATCIDDHGLDTALKLFDQLSLNPGNYNFDEEEFDALGNRLLDDKNLDAAVVVFALNTKMFPDSWSAEFSLAIAHMNERNREDAEKSLKSVLDKNPRFWLADFILSDLDRRIDRVCQERENPLKPGEQTGIKGPYLGQSPPGLTGKIFAPGIVSKALALNFSCTFSPDGREFYYNHFMNIMVCRLTDDGWTAPETASFTEGHRALEPHISPDGERLFFGWFLPEPKGRGIYMFEKTDEGWANPKHVIKGGSLTTTLDGKIYVSDRRIDGQSQVKQTHFNNDILTVLEPLRGGLTDLATQFPISSHPCISPDGRILLFDTSMKSGLWAAFLDVEGVWSKPVQLSDYGLSPLAGIAMYSPDGKYIFYNVKGDIFWISAEFVENLRPDNE